MNIDRRHFIQASAASLLFVGRTAAVPAKVAVSEKAGTARVEGKTYTWEWATQTDRWRLLDKKGRVMTSGPLQPAILVQVVGGKDRPAYPGPSPKNKCRATSSPWSTST